MENANTLAALAEQNRFRIVELLRERPHAVSEIVEKLGLRQPQVTKHLQTLEKAGLVLVYPVAQRRIYTLRAAPLKDIAEWASSFQPLWENPHMPEEHIRRIKREQALAAKNSSWADGREVVINRTFAASRQTVWSFWTNAANLKQWWSPKHLTPSYTEADARPGGVIRVDMQEPDGATHTAAGIFEELIEPERLKMTMWPLDDKGNKLFDSHMTIDFTQKDDHTTELTLAITINVSVAEAASYIASIELGWNQTLDHLAQALSAAEGSESSM